MAEQKPMPEWIKNLTVPASTKQYLYERWLNGDIAPKSPPQDWGAITDLIEFFKKIKFKNDVVKNEITTEPLLRKKLDPKQIDTDLAAAQKALDDGVANYKYEKKVYSLTELRDVLIPNLETSKEQAADQKSKQETAEFIASTQLSADENFAKSALGKFKDKEITEAELKTAQNAVKTSKLVLDRVRKGELASVIESPETGKYQVQFVSDVPVAAAAEPTAVTPKVTGTPAAILSQQGRVATAAQMEDRAEQARFAGMKPKDIAETTTEEIEPVVPTTGVVSATPVVDPAKRKAFVTAQLGARGLENTPANREILRKEYVASLAKPVTVDGKPVDGKPTTVSNAWEKTFRETFPAKAWLLDLDRTKYPQLFQLLNTAISQEWYKSPEGLTRFTASLDATDFYKEISNSKQLKVIQSLVGTLGFEGSDFTKFVSDSINFGYSGDILKQKVYSEVFKKDDAGNYINPTALERTKKSADYISTQNIAKAFFNINPADSDIEKVLTGQMLAADYERQQREFAKSPGRYGHLSNLLDQGMTMESIASAYKTTASRLLELNPNAIDMSTGAFEQAVTFGEDGKKRLMTNGEWEKLLRTDPQYGWEKTNNAKEEARSLSANIAQAFGRIL
jgi:hypothetical protein